MFLVLHVQFDDYEVYCNVSHAGNGSSIGSVEDFERKITFGDGLATFEGKNRGLVDPKNDHKEILGFEKEEINEVEDKLILLCDVRDEKGWQCGRMVKNDETMCVHHVIDHLQNHAVWTTKKEPRPVHESKAGSRSRQTKKRASTSPYEFYYYSGFGPTWGKKRGTTAGSGVSNMDYNEPAKVAFDDNKIKETSVINDGMGICDDEDDKERGKTGKKRGRKPMKARSLKSLM
ncbi:uncharacterized protein LOC143563047 [Bidens hawaiensis]|uniref:uncharacterized protein LOC143563047 n=1 Tax=Bidens hawaiensis TaxID=980011 RepID=UPI00404A10F5